ncbi:hypothetical protein ACIGO9_14490 [Nocardia asteroides]|uniref:hypothetical protein n=1 Tax=Nocardia asteroides TaxID=1824 RepID=UPI0037C97F97
MLITALVLALVGVIRGRLRGRTGQSAASRRPGSPVRRAVGALRRAGVRVLREPLPALSAAIGVLGLAVVGTHLVCGGAV